MHQTTLYLNTQNKCRNTTKWEDLLQGVFGRAGRQIRLQRDTGDLITLNPANRSFSVFMNQLQKLFNYKQILKFLY